MSVSVICTAKNAEATIEETLASVLAQDIDDWEMVVVDDGSGDSTADIVAAFAAKDARIRLLRTGGVGRGRALNLALRAARFELVANVDADDPSHPARLGRQRAVLAAHPEFVLVCSDYRILIGDAPCHWESSAGEEALVVDVTHLLLRTNPIIHASVMMRRDAVLALGGYAENRPTHLDYDLWIRLAAAGNRLGRLEHRLVGKRMHAGQSFEHRRRPVYLLRSAAMQAHAIRVLDGGWRHWPLVPARFLWGLMPGAMRRRFSRLARR